MTGARTAPGQKTSPCKAEGDACVARRCHSLDSFVLAKAGDASVPSTRPPFPRPYRIERNRYMGVEMAHQKYQRDLGDGLLLRWSTSDDIENLVELVSTVFRDRAD